MPAQSPSTSQGLLGNNARIGRLITWQVQAMWYVRRHHCRHLPLNVGNASSKCSPNAIQNINRGVQARM